jgi:hypothetical protein
MSLTEAARNLFLPKIFPLFDGASQKLTFVKRLLNASKSLGISPIDVQEVIVSRLCEDDNAVE